MSEYVLSPNQRDLLHELMDRLDRSAIAERRISLRVTEDRFPQYFDESHPAELRCWEQDILSLEAQGWLEIERGKGADAHRLSRISLNRAHHLQIGKALRRLSREDFRRKMIDLVHQYRMQYQHCREEFPAWWPRFLEREGESATRLNVAHEHREAQLAEQQLFLEAMMRIVAPELRRSKTASPLSWRQFAVGEFADSKKLNSLKPRIVKTLAQFARPDLPWQEGESANILAEFGLELKQELLLLGGPFRAKGLSLTVEGAQWSPFAALPRQTIIEQKFSWDFSLCEGVLTIENEESFQSWCRVHPHSHWLSLYLAGFPSKFKLDFLRQIPLNFPIFHWGDLDVGGIQIYHHLETELDRQIRPYAMEPMLLSEFSDCAQPLSAFELSRLNTLAKALNFNHPLQALIAEMQRLQLKLEQEVISRPDKAICI